MSLTASNSFPVGAKAPSFYLPNTVDTNLYTLDDLKGEKGTAIVFICNHCPYVLHINEELVVIANEYTPKNIRFIAINSNDIENYPADAPSEMKVLAKKLGYTFPYLYDESQDIARSYNAACTPDFYLFDADLKSVYHGQLDDSRPRSGLSVTGKDFRQAMDNLLTGKLPLSNQKPSMGCNIKWKSS